MPKPNLLFIYTDEQAAATMAAYATDLIETPNLNRLAARSIVFEKHMFLRQYARPRALRF